MARSITFCSSRTLPGQLYRSRRAIACSGQLLGLKAAGSALEEKMLGQQPNIAAPAAQGGQLDGKDVQAVKEITPEGLVLDFFPPDPGWWPR